MRCFLIIFWRAFFQEALFKFLPKKVAGENSMQIGPNFPAKSLIYYILHQFLLIPFHKLIEKYLIN